MAAGAAIVADGITLWDLLSQRVALTPDRMMAVDEHDRSLTFAQVRDLSERVAAGLLARGIGPGHRVTWQLPTAIDTVVLSLALARLGAVQNPIIALYRQREVSFLIDEIGTQLYVVRRHWRGFDFEGMAGDIQATAQRPFDVLCVEDGLPDGDPATLPAPPSDPHEVRWLYATSGTTANPKAVRHTDATLIAGGSGMVFAYGVRPDDVGHVPWPYAHIGGPDYLVLMLCTGMGTLFTESFVPDEAWELMRRHRVTVSGGSTAHYVALLAAQRQAPGTVIVPTLRAMYAGGAPKPPELYWQLLAESGVKACHGYGMTEAPMIAAGSPDDTDEQLANTEGRPVKACEVRVVDEQERPVPAGRAGDIQVRGPMVFLGYTDPDLTKAAFTDDGFFRTGDRGVLRADGHITLTGRTKEMIIRKGENISPLEIEDVLMTHPAISAVAVIGLADPERGERVCAVIEPRAGATAPTFAEVQQLCRAAGLMTQKFPEQLEVVDALPRNATMKILKRELVERYTTKDS